MEKRFLQFVDDYGCDVAVPVYMIGEKKREI